MPISIKIDVTKIDKARLFKGAKGVYLDLVLFESKDTSKGDFIVKQDQSQDDRKSGKQTPILGNAKHFGNSTRTPGTPSGVPDNSDSGFGSGSEDLPF